MKKGNSEGSGAASGLKAVVLAGGRGTRLQPFTVNFPKPLVPLGDVPVLEVLLTRLLGHGITDITLTVGHLAELIKAYFQHRESLSRQLSLAFVAEEQPTGTAGSLGLVPDLAETFLVMNGDLLTNLNFHSLVDFHRSQDAVMTIASHEREIKIDLGVLEFDGEHRVTEYFEKPEHRYRVSMGIYVYEPRALSYLGPRGSYMDFPELVLKLLAAGERVCAYSTDCMWLDIGRPDDYAKAQELFTEDREAFDRV